MSRALDSTTLHTNKTAAHFQVFGTSLTRQRSPERNASETLVELHEASVIRIMSSSSRVAAEIDLADDSDDGVVMRSGWHIYCDGGAGAARRVACLSFWQLRAV